MTLAVIKKILENKEARQEFVSLLERRTTAFSDEIKLFLNTVCSMIHNLYREEEQIIVKEEIQPAAIYHTRTYIIAAHMYLEIKNSELHYETLIRDTTALKEFITARFKANKISGRIAHMKTFLIKKSLPVKILLVLRDNYCRKSNKLLIILKYSEQMFLLLQEIF